MHFLKTTTSTTTSGHLTGLCGQWILDNAHRTCVS